MQLCYMHLTYIQEEKKVFQQLLFINILSIFQVHVKTKQKQYSIPSSLIPRLPWTTPRTFLSAKSVLCFTFVFVVVTTVF